MSSEDLENNVIPITYTLKQRLKEVLRAMGMNPEQYLTREALSEGATTIKNPEDLEDYQLSVPK